LQLHNPAGHPGAHDVEAAAVVAAAELVVNVEACVDDVDDVDDVGAFVGVALEPPVAGPGCRPPSQWYCVGE